MSNSGNMSFEQAKQRIEALRRVLEDSNRRYYVDNAPIIAWRIASGRSATATRKCGENRQDFYEVE